MLDPRKISLPSVDRLADQGALQLACKILGFALVVQWFLPWVGHQGTTYYSWDLMREGRGVAFVLFWSLAGGASFVAFGFLRAQLLAPPLIAAATGIGLIGLLALAQLSGSAPPTTPLVGFFVLLWGVTSGAGLYLLQGGALLVGRILLFASLLACLLWLVVPIDGMLPLVYIFKVWSMSEAGLVWRLVAFIGMLSPIALAALTALHCLVPGAKVQYDWVRLLFWGHLACLPLVLALLGLVGMFTSPWFLFWNIHLLTICVAFGVPLVMGGSLILAERRAAGAGDLWRRS